MTVMTWSANQNGRFVLAGLLLILLSLLYWIGRLIHGHVVILNDPLQGESCLSKYHTDFRDEDRETLIPGGRFKPLGCESGNRVAVIVPYRDRKTHLETFLKHMHPFLQRQEIDYGIFVVEMLPGVKFNRALLMNIGFMESRRQYGYHCYIFHDVDLLPENDEIRYTCTSSPTHFSVAIDSKNYTMPYENYFGGVCAISKEHFEKINGFSNIYFDWGGEDDDLFGRNVLFKTSEERFQTDGLNSLKYRLVKYELKRLYTWILVSVNETEVMDNEPTHKRNEFHTNTERTKKVKGATSNRMT